VTDAIELRHPPAFAGGRLLWWNRILRASVRAEAEGRSLRLILDPDLLREADRKLPIQNAHGDIVRLPTPESGSFHDAAQRDAYRDALEDLLPSTGAGRAAIDLLLPAPGVSLMDAAVQLWSTLFPELEVLPASAMPPNAAEEKEPLETGWTWLGAHHRKAIAELGVDPAIAAAGQEALSTELGREPQGELGAEVEALRAEMDRRARELAPLAEEVSEQLLGALRRMRRDLRLAIGNFARSADRSGRNRSARRGTRVHLLAQALRPLDLPQELGLSLLAAVALFHLEFQNPAHYRTSLATGGHADSLLLDS
jgi:hypothetical protein